MKVDPENTSPFISIIKHRKTTHQNHPKHPSVFFYQSTKSDDSASQHHKLKLEIQGLRRIEAEKVQGEWRQQSTTTRLIKEAAMTWQCTPRASVGIQASRCPGNRPIWWWSAISGRRAVSRHCRLRRIDVNDVGCGWSMLKIVNVCFE